MPLWAAWHHQTVYKLQASVISRHVLHFHLTAIVIHKVLLLSIFGADAIEKNKLRLSCAPTGTRSLEYFLSQTDKSECNSSHVSHVREHIYMAVIIHLWQQSWWRSQR